MSLNPEKKKQYWDIVERILASMPREAAEVCRKVAQEIVETDGELDPKELNAKFSEAFSDALNSGKPVKTIKLTPRLVKQVKADLTWREEKRKQAKKLDEKMAALKKESAELSNEIADRKANLNALVMVEHGINDKKVAFRINEKTMEIEVMMTLDVLQKEAASRGLTL